jgi:hypothetical protein
LKEEYQYSKKQLESFFHNIPLPTKLHTPRTINLVVDATFFGTKDTLLWGVVVFRDFHGKENLWWEFVLDETTKSYDLGRKFLEDQGYIIASVTIDGLPGLSRVFDGIPVQFCHFHEAQIVRRYVTQNPKLKAGHDLLELVKTLTFTTEDVFKHRLMLYIDRYRDFLNEKTMNLTTGKDDYTHRRLRSAIRSLQHNLHLLFTFQRYPELRIPTTNNALESHFSHIKDIVRIHRGLSRFMKQKVIHFILLNSSIVLKRKRKE